MPEHLILSEHSDNTCELTLPNRFSLHNNSKNRELIYDEPEYRCCSDYEVTNYWKQFEIPLDHTLDVSTWSSKQTAALPPLASVFATNSSNFNASLHTEKEEEHYLDEKHFLTYLGASEKSFTITKDETQTATTSNPESFYAEKFLNGSSFPNLFLQKSYGKNGTNLSALENTRFVRKRSHNSIKDKLLPPNVNTAFKKLRNLIPTEPADRRLSKVETLRLAVSYIQHLGQALNTEHWVEQPCLVNKIVREASDKMATPICTFCMSKKRKVCTNSR